MNTDADSVFAAMHADLLGSSQHGVAMTYKVAATGATSSVTGHAGAERDDYEEVAEGTRRIRARTIRILATDVAAPAITDSVQISSVWYVVMSITDRRGAWELETKRQDGVERHKQGYRKEY